jgi:hypothetical protein
MTSSRLKALARYVGGWGLLIFFVGLLTSIFSFLGTFICAVLAGAMLGATRPGRGQSLAISLVFPATIFTLLRVSRAALADRQIGVLALLCFGAFWFTYAATWGVMALESKQRAANTTPSGARVARRPSRAGWPGQALTLDVLQGKWLCQMPRLTGQVQEKLMEITGRKLTLRVTDGCGQVSLSSKAVLNLDTSTSPPRLTLSRPPDDSPGDLLVSI